MAVIPHLRLLDDGGLVGVDGCGHLQGPVGEMECVVSEWAEITRAVRINGALPLCYVPQQHHSFFSF